MNSIDALEPAQCAAVDQEATRFQSAVIRKEGGDAR